MIAPTYETKLDGERIDTQRGRVARLMLLATEQDRWLTLREIAAGTGFPEASISARLRDLRKARFGSYSVLRRRRGEPSRGLWEYSVREGD